MLDNQLTFQRSEPNYTWQRSPGTGLQSSRFVYSLNTKILRRIRHVSNCAAATKVLLLQLRWLPYLRSGCWIPCCGWADRWWTGSSRLDPRWSLPQKVSAHRDPSRTAPQSRRPGRSTAPTCRATRNGCKFCVRLINVWPVISLFKLSFWFPPTLEQVSQQLLNASYCLHYPVILCCCCRAGSVRWGLVAQTRQTYLTQAIEMDGIC